MSALEQKDSRVGFIGAGNMANSLIRGMIAKGHPANAIYAADLDDEKLKRLSEECGIQTGTSAELATQCDVLVLAVKPQVMQPVCLELSDKMNGSSTLVISIAAGITSEHLATWLGESVPIVRCMPNTPALVGKGASGLFATDKVSDENKSLAESLLSAVGLSLWVDNESAIDAVTAVSGSGPAYFFLFMEAMQEAGIKMGLDSETAKALTYQTALGAAELALSSTESTEQLRRNVTSPGGTTEQAINTFESGDLRKLVEAALNAAEKRSAELAEEFGKN